VILTKEQITKIRFGSVGVPRQLSYETATDLLDTIVYLEHLRDTAHTEAIQEAHDIVERAFTHNWMLQDTLDAILALKPRF
jgi:hypothetical protein